MSSQEVGKDMTTDSRGLAFLNSSKSRLFGLEHM